MGKTLFFVADFFLAFENAWEVPGIGRVFPHLSGNNGKLSA
jgi:hypothetical protein